MAWIDESYGPAGQNIKHPALDRVVAAERANREYNRFQVKANEPGARFAEQKHYWMEKGANPDWWHGSQNAYPLRTNQFGVCRSSTSMGMPSQPASEYYDEMKGLNQFHREDMNRRLFQHPESKSALRPRGPRNSRRQPGLGRGYGYFQCRWRSHCKLYSFV